MNRMQPSVWNEWKVYDQFFSDTLCNGHLKCAYSWTMLLRCTYEIPRGWLTSFLTPLRSTVMERLHRHYGLQCRYFLAFHLFNAVSPQDVHNCADSFPVSICKLTAGPYAASGANWTAHRRCGCTILFRPSSLPVPQVYRIPCSVRAGVCSSRSQASG